MLGGVELAPPLTLTGWSLAAPLLSGSEPTRWVHQEEEEITQALKQTATAAGPITGASLELAVPH